MKETASGGNVSFVSVVQSDNARGAGSDNILLETRGGTLVVASNGSGIVNLGTGDVTLVVAGNALIDENLATTSGSISVTASGSIVNWDDSKTDGVITSTGGSITVYSTAANVTLGGNLTSEGGLIDVHGTTGVDMVSGKKASSLNADDTGQIVFLADTGNVSLSLLEADGAITVTATTGSIVNGLVGAGLNVDGDTATLTMTAATMETLPNPASITPTAILPTPFAKRTLPSLTLISASPSMVIKPAACISRL